MAHESGAVAARRPASLEHTAQVPQSGPVTGQTSFDSPVESTAASLDADAVQLSCQEQLQQQGQIIAHFRQCAVDSQQQHGKEGT